MTKCGGYQKKLMSFDTFEQMCEWCGTKGRDRDYLREEWKVSRMLKQALEEDTMGIPMDDIPKMPMDALVPLIRDYNKDVQKEVLKKVESFIKNGEQLTRAKVDEFIARARGVCKGPPPKLHACSAPFCLNARLEPVWKDGKPYCSEECASAVHKPIPRTEKKKYDPLKPFWKELLHPTKSKMEREVITELQAEGWPIDTDYWIPLTQPDGYLHEIRLPLEVDGEHVHRGKKAERDDLVNEILQHRGIEPARERFSHYSVKRKEEIKNIFRERMIEGYRKKGLPLPVKVQERMEALQ